MVRGITYDKQLFKSDDFSLMTKRFFNNTDGIVKGCTLATSGNTVTISTGWFVSSGYYNNISTQEVVSITQSGTLVYEIDLTKTNTSTEFNQGSFKVITTTPTQEDLFNGGTLYQMPVATVTTDGSSATITATLWSDIQADFQTQINSKFDSSKFALITGQLTIPTGEGSTATDNISYPTGFTKDNCIIISLMRTLGAGSNAKYYYHDISDVGTGAYSIYFVLSDDYIVCNAYNHSSSSGEIVSKYKIMLMKIS